MSASISLIDRAIVRQALSREWAPHLSPTQFKLVDMIYDRTLAWGRLDCAISVPEFSRGGGGQKTYSRGTGLGSTAIYNALKVLVQLGVIIKRTSPGRKSVYSLNLKWAAMSLPPQKKAPTRGLQAPKQRAAKTPPPNVRVAPPTPPPNGGHRKRKQDRKGSGSAAPITEQGSSPKAYRPVSVAKKAMDALVDRISENGRERAAQAKVSDRIRDLQARWADKVREHWPNDRVLSWSPRARGLVKHAVRNKVFADMPPGEIVDWAVENWGLLRTVTFKWMTDAPASPDPQFFATHLYRIVSAYTTRETLKQELALSGTDRVKARHRRGGMTDVEAHEAADAEARMASMVSREEHDALKARLAQEAEARRRMDAQLRAAAGRVAKPDLKDFDRE